MINLIADLHLHTVASGHAYSTIAEYVTAAKARGLKIIAITDHGPNMPGGAHLYHFQNLRMVPEEMDGIRILKGAECNIIDEEGQLDIPPDTQKKLEVIMATFHPRCGYEGGTEEENTEVLLKTIKNSLVNVLAHPGNPQYPVNVSKIVEAAREHKVMIELNASSFTSRPGSWERCLEFAREIKRAGGKAVIGSDAHIASDMGRFDQALKLAEEAGMTEEDIVNSSVERIERYILKSSPLHPSPQSGEGNT